MSRLSLSLSLATSAVLALGACADSGVPTGPGGGALRATLQDGTDPGSNNSAARLFDGTDPGSNNGQGGGKP